MGLYNRYWEYVSKVRRCTREEESELRRRLREEHDTEAKQELFDKFMWLVQCIAKKWVARYPRYGDDIVQNAYKALWTCLCTYKDDSSLSLYGYLCISIEREIVRYICKEVGIEGRYVAIAEYSTGAEYDDCLMTSRFSKSEVEYIRNTVESALDDVKNRLSCKNRLKNGGDWSKILEKLYGGDVTYSDIGKDVGISKQAVQRVFDAVRERLSKDEILHRMWEQL